MISHTRGRALPPSEPAGVVAYLSPAAPGAVQEPILPFAHYLRRLRRHWWKIALAVTVCTALAAYLSTRITPVYQSTARVTIGENIPSAVVGAEAAQSSAGDFDQMVNTEMQLIQSDAVLRPVSEEFHLLNPAAHSPEGPVVLRDLTVVHVPNSRLIDISYRSKDRVLAAKVANAVAHSYILRNQETRVNSSTELSGFMERQIAELKKNMQNSAEALAEYQRQLGVINPSQKTSILTSRLLQLNSQYIDAENDRIRKETEFHAIQSGSPDAALEVSSQATALTALDERMRAAQEKMEQVKTVYGPGYPEYKRAANDLEEITRQDTELRAKIAKRIDAEYHEALHREDMLRASLAATKSESDKLGETSFQYEQLEREAEANTNLFNELNRKIKEDSINAGFQNSAIRLADEARPALHPVFPRKSLFIFFGFMISLLTSFVAIVLAEFFDKTVRDPEQTRQITGFPVVGSLPDVRDFPAQCLPIGSPQYLPAGGSSDIMVSQDFYRECIASTLSSVLHGRLGAKIRSVLITSPGPGEGKSSCAAYLAAANAAQGKRTLLVDADLRRPSQHKYLGISQEGGLAAIIDGTLTLDEARKSVPGMRNLDVIVAGTACKDPASLVGRRVSELIDEAAKEYDLVVVDAPPMMNFAEPIQIACGTDGVLLVSHAGRTSRQAVADALQTLRNVGANVMGLILNRVQLETHFDYTQYRAYMGQSSRLAAAYNTK